MPYEPKVILGRVGNSFRVTIPKNMIEDLNWKEGDVLRIGLEGNKITIRKE
jgi:AbrB family looped-hinge helix DNA binding protein